MAPLDPRPKVLFPPDGPPEIVGSDVDPTTVALAYEGGLDIDGILARWPTLTPGQARLVIGLRTALLRPERRAG